MLSLHFQFAIEEKEKVISLDTHLCVVGENDAYMPLYHFMHEKQESQHKLSHHGGTQSLSVSSWRTLTEKLWYLHFLCYCYLDFGRKNSHWDGFKLFKQSSCISRTKKQVCHLWQLWHLYFFFLAKVRIRFAIYGYSFPAFPIFWFSDKLYFVNNYIIIVSTKKLYLNRYI